MTSDELKYAAEYNRGYEDGKKAKSAGEWRLARDREDVVRKLREVKLDGGSHANLSEICKCVYHTDEWTPSACVGLRDELISLLGGNADKYAFVEYDVLGNARHKAVCRLEESKPLLGMTKTEILGDLGKAITNAPNFNPTDIDHLNLMWSTLIHLLGGDNGTCPNENGTCPIGIPLSSITTELREYIDDKESVYFGGPVGERLRAIADRIDAQFARICEQQERVLQATIGHMVDNKPTPIVDGITTNLRKSMHPSMDGEWLTIEWGDFVSECDRIDNRCMDTIISVHDSMESECNKLAIELAKTKELLEISYAKRRAYKLHIDQMKGGSKKWRKRYEDAQTLAEVNEQECAELLELLRDTAEDYRKLQDKYDMREGVVDAAIASLKDCVVLPKDADGVTWSFGDRFTHKGKTYEVSAMRLFETGKWGLETSERDGNFNPTAFTHAHTAEEIVRDLTLGRITEKEAVKRIEELRNE